MESLSNWIVAEAKQLGFDACGIARATALEKSRRTSSNGSKSSTKAR